MRFLLDTNALIFVMAAPGRLGAEARAKLADAQETQVSLVSLWEIATKAASGRLGLRPGDVAAQLKPANIRLLGLTVEHVVAYGGLPRQPDHRDPFDRFIVAQALHEGLTLVTSDRRLGGYGVPILPA